MISDADKAQRYRRKLVDLIERIKTWDYSRTGQSEMAMLREAALVKEQLEIEDRHSLVKESLNG